MKDEEAIGRTLRGDTNTFEALVHRSQGLVFKVAYSITDNWHTAEDVAQETFLRAFQNVDRLRQPGSIKAWLVTTTKRLALRHHRARQSERCIFVGVDPERFDPRNGASYRWSQPCEVKMEVASALSELSKEAKEVTVLHYLEGLPLEAIATRLRIPVGTMLERMADIHALFERLNLHPKGVGWDKVAWPLIGFGFVELTVTKCVTEPIESPLKPSGRCYFFQRADFQEMAWRIVGCNMHTEGPWAAMQYWSPEVHPPTMGWPKHPASLLEPLVENLKDGVPPDVLLERGAVADEMELARLVEGGILSSSGGRVHLTVPCFPAEEWETLRRDANRLMEPFREGICEMLQGAEALLNELRFEHLDPIYPEGKRLLAANIARECMMGLKEAGALPEVSESASDAWGTIACRYPTG